MKKKIVLFILTITMLLSLVACGEDNRVSIPDVIDTDEASAKNILSSNSLIPSIKYEYDNDIKQGNVIKTTPAVGTQVDKNSKITVYISNGPSYIQSKGSRMEWYSISDGKDDWSFHAPYIEKDVLYIECNVAFACAMEWKDTYNEGLLGGIASITDSFDKTIPISAEYEKQSWSANESQSFTLNIPLSDLNISKPTDMYLKLSMNDGNQIRVNFYMTW